MQSLSQALLSNPTSGAEPVLYSFSFRRNRFRDGHRGNALQQHVPTSEWRRQQDNDGRESVVDADVVSATDEFDSHIGKVDRQRRRRDV